MRGGRLLGAAAGVAAVTLLARAAGFGRTAVLARTVGPSCTGDAYTAANAVPNVVFEVVAGGALAALVVPLVAGAVVAGDREAAARTSSALLCRALAVLVPLAALGWLVAPALARLVLGTDPACGPAAVELATSMLRVFVLQVPLYGVGVVLAGVLQAHRRFLGPAVAPLLSSLVVASAYVAYGVLGAAEPGDLPRSRELVLSVGTTVGVAALSLPLLVPLRRAGVRLRPAWALPPDLLRRGRALALAGTAVLAAQQVATVVGLRLAAGDDEGAVVLLLLATAVVLVPWAVLAVPVATTAFPRLAASTGREYDDVARSALRAVLVLGPLSAGVLVAAAEPVARLLVAGAPGSGDVDALAAAVRALALGLPGYALVALLGRALAARGDARASAQGPTLGWLVGAAGAALLVAATSLPAVVAVGLGTALGHTVGGALLLSALGRRAPGAVAPGRAGLAGLLGGGLAATAALVVPVTDGVATTAVAALAAVVVATAAGALVVAALDRPALREVLRA